MSTEDLLTATFADYEGLAPDADELLEALRRAAGSRPSRRRHHLVIAASAAGVLVLALALTVIGLKHQRANSPAGPPGSSTQPASDSVSAPSTGQRLLLTCRSVTGASVEPDRQVIQARAAALGARDVTIETVGDRLRVGLTGIASTDVAPLCAFDGVLTVRGVVMAPVPSRCGQNSAPGCSPTAVSDAADQDGFAVPTSDSDYTALTSQQQTDLVQALASFDCGAQHTPATTPYVVQCAPGSTFGLDDNTVAVLLGTRITGSDELASAATTPDSPQGSTVSITLNDAGRQALADYTTAHATSSATLPHIADCGAASSQRCSAYLGIVTDRSVLSAMPINHATLDGTLQVANHLDSHAASALAANLQSGPVPVPLQPATVTATR